uniref:Coilin n=1 Tax=Nannospalax galili TaxID=1026970 RepID=A0A8C6QBR4_NANGA
SNISASETVRLRLQFDYRPPATPHCLNKRRVVTDLISLICQRFGFSSRALLGLYLEGGLLPPAKSARLVPDNDCLRVKLEDRETPENLVLVSNGDDSYFTPRKAKKLVEDEELELGYKCFKKHWKKQKSNSHNENALDLETKPGKKQEKNTADEEEESKKKSPERKEKCEHRKQSRNPKSPKAQKEWSLQNCSLPKGAPRSNLAKARRKGRASAGPKGGPNSVPESESSGESSSNGQGSVTAKGGNAADKLSAELLKVGLATKTTALNKSMFTFNPSKGKATRASSSSSYFSSDSDKKCVVSKNTSPSAADLLKTAGLFAGRGCPGPGLLLQTPGTIGWKPSDSSKGRQDPGLPGVSVPTNLGRGWGRGEDFLSWRGPRGQGIWGKGQGQGHAIFCILNRNLECQKEQQLNEINPVEIHEKDYSLLPLLAAAPQVGEKIAFKLLELTSNYSPDVSDYKEGKILSHDPETQQVDIEILSSLPALKEPGKFDLVYHNENGTEVVEYTVAQERRITVLWKELIDPRLIIESASNISSA